MMQNSRNAILYMAEIRDTAASMVGNPGFPGAPSSGMTMQRESDGGGVHRRGEA